MVSQSINKQSFSVPNLPTHSVTIYPSRAVIVRDISNVMIFPGINEITLNHLTPNAEKHSIKAELHNTAGLVTEMAVDLVPNAFYDILLGEDSNEDDGFSSEDSDDPPSYDDIDEEEWEILSLKATVQEEAKAIALLADEEASHLFRLRMAEEYFEHWTTKTTEPPSEAMAEELSAYHESRKGIFSELQTTRHFIATREAIIDRAERRIEKARATRELERETERREKKLETPKDVYRVRITIELESLPEGATSAAAVVAPTSRLESAGDAEVPAGSGEGPSLRVSYVTNGASWTPRYNAMLDSLANTGVLTCRAHICNRTGEAWRDGGVTLSIIPMSQTSFGGLEDKAPGIDPWCISLRPNKHGNDRDGGLYSAKEKELRNERKLKRLTDGHGKKREYQEHDDPSGTDGDKGSSTTNPAAPSTPPGIATPTTESYGLTTTYDLSEALIVAYSAQFPQYIIAEHKLTDITFSHFSMPKLRPSVFLRADIRNPSPSALLRGPAGLSLDGTFLGTTTIPLCAPGGRFELDLGVDESVLVEYPRPACAVVSQDMAKTQVLTYERCASIHNTRKNPISLVVSDQVPVSNDERLKVRVRKPLALRDGDSAKGTAAGILVVSADEKVAEGLADAAVEMKEGGEVRWEAKVEGGMRIRIGLEYEAELPAGAKIHEV